MIRRIIILLAHDLAVAFKNKTVYLIVCIPLLVYATLMLVDPTDAHRGPLNLAWIETGTPPPAALEHLRSAAADFAVRGVATTTEAARLLKQRAVDGILEPAAEDPSRLSLTVARHTAPETLAILQRVAALQTAVTDGPADWIADLRPLQTGSLQRQTLPTWILMMVLLMGFIVLPTQIAEEKEKQLLLGWLQTPVREWEWLLAKLAYGLILMLVAVGALQGLCQATPHVHGLWYLAMLCAGGFCFAALGICLGLLSRTQASARTLGVLCYLPLLLPAALSDLSQEMSRIAPLVPSYHFYEPIRALLLQADGGGAYHFRAWLILVAIGLLACLASRRLLKIRWLMQ